MAKIKYDIRGTERGGGEFDTTIEPGLYAAKVKSCDLGQSKPSEKNPKGLQMLKVIFELTNSKWKGALISTNVFPGYEAAAWKWAEFLDAVWLVKGKKEAGSFDTDKVVGAPVQLRIKAGSYDGEYKPEIGKVLPPKDEDPEDDDEEDEDEPDVDEDDEDDEEEDEDDSSDDDDDDDDEEEDDDDDEEEDYNTWSLDDLKAEIKHRRIKITGKGTKKALIKALEADDEDDDIFGDD